MAAATAAALWQPREDGLREICGLLEQQISPSSDQARIWQQLQQYNQLPDFNNYLVFILAHAEVFSLPPSVLFDPSAFCGGVPRLLSGLHRVWLLDGVLCVCNLGGLGVFEFVADQ